MIGQPCAYCARPLAAKISESQLAATKDHVEPKSRGGRLTVYACRQCNDIKRDMSADEWRAFMAANPTWWEKPQYAKFGTRASVARWKRGVRRERKAFFHAVRLADKTLGRRLNVEEVRAIGIAMRAGTAAENVLVTIYPEWFVDPATPQTSP